MAEAPHEDDISSEICVFCGESMKRLKESIGQKAGGTILRACTYCGWWTYWQQTCSPVFEPDTRRSRWSLYGAAAQLKNLDEIDMSHGLEEVKRYLIAKYEARFDLHPRLFEETVGSVFIDLGFDTEVTAYSADGGIDVILRHSNDITTGIQVKRVKSAIEVEQIRALAGALMLGGHTQGVFVTTSHFRSGAISTAKRLRHLAMPVELIDATRFLQALRITQRPAYESYFEWQDLFGYPPELVTIYENEVEGG